MNDFFEHIGDYLSKNLSEKDHSLFEEAMKNDPALARAVENHSIVSESLELLIEDDIRSVINNINSHPDQSEKTGINDSYLGIRTFLIVAGIMILLAIIAYFINRISKPDTEILYAQYYSEYLEPDLRGSEPVPIELSQCDQGHRMMQNEQYPEAKIILELSAKSDDNCTDKSQWYLSLIYLLDENYEGLDSLLTIIKTDTESPYKLKAEALYKSLH